MDVLLPTFLLTGVNKMAFDGITIANLAWELKHALEGGKIAKIAQPEKDELLITIKNNKENYRLQSQPAQAFR